MAAAHQVGVQAGVFARIGLAEDGDRRAFRRGRVRRTARVEPDAAVVAEPADAAQEGSVAAAELDDGLAVQVIAIDQPLGERGRIALEVGRKIEGVLVVLVVAHPCGVEGKVEDVAATAAKTELDPSPRRGAGGFAGTHQQVAVNRHVGDLREPVDRTAAADGTPIGRRGALLSGGGHGLTIMCSGARPPGVSGSSGTRRGDRPRRRSSSLISPV